MSNKKDHSHSIISGLARANPAATIVSLVGCSEQHGGGGQEVNLLGAYDDPTMPSDISALALIRADGKTRCFQLRHSDKDPLEENDKKVTFPHTHFNILLDRSSCMLNVFKADELEFIIKSERGAVYAVITRGGVVKKYIMRGTGRLKTKSGTVEASILPRENNN